MSETISNDVDEFPCVNHPGTLTALACGKCGVYICPRCMVFTPVGVRCRDCAQLRKLPQFDVSVTTLAIAGGVGFGVAFVCWFVALHVFLFAWLLAIFIGIAVGEVTSRLARRRVSRTLEVAVGADIVLGFLAARFVEFVSVPGVGLPQRQATPLTIAALNDPFALLMLGLAVVVAVTRLRR